MPTDAIGSMLRRYGYGFGDEARIEAAARRLAEQGCEPWDLKTLWQRAQVGFHPEGLFCWWVDRGVWPKVLAPRDLPRRPGWVRDLLPLVIQEVAQKRLRRVV